MSILIPRPTTMHRRPVLKIIALSLLSPSLESAKAAWTPGDYRLRFFTAAENALLDHLTEMIIPADSHSPGAHAAQVSLYIDLVVGTSPADTQMQWKEGLQLLQQEAARSSLSQALALAASGEEHPAAELERFFVALKQMTINGYYTSEIGIHQDLQYQGNTYLPEFADGSGA
jgi:glucoside 3-dehydrogenase (cytochrome c) hitch-hiker subunit